MHADALHALRADALQALIVGPFPHLSMMSMPTVSVCSRQRRSCKQLLTLLRVMQYDDTTQRK